MTNPGHPPLASKLGEEISIEPGSNILIAGPPMTRKRELAISTVADGDTNQSIFITTNKQATQIRSEFERITGNPCPELRVVDCLGKSSMNSPKEAPYTKHVGTPSDLTGIGMATMGYMQELHHESVDEVHVSLSSLSTLMMYAKLQRVYQFVHILSGRANNVGYRTVFTIDTAENTIEALNPFKQLFDVFIETRETETGQELRVRGDASGSRCWTEY